MMQSWLTNNQAALAPTLESMLGPYALPFTNNVKRLWIVLFVSDVEVLHRHDIMPSHFKRTLKNTKQCPLFSHVLTHTKVRYYHTIYNIQSVRLCPDSFPMQPSTARHRAFSQLCENKTALGLGSFIKPLFKNKTKHSELNIKTNKIR